jgi:putative phosphoribosyl transferase
MKKSETELIISVGKVEIIGNLVVPENKKAIVIFSHGSGSSRFSPRNKFVADVLNKENIATLLIDLLTPEEDEIYQNRFDIDLLAARLKSVTEYIREYTLTKALPIGYFGASTGAASALKAAADLNDSISAIVSRGGRPDLAENELPDVKAPVLLIVGGWDHQVIKMNQSAYNSLNCMKNLVIIEGATHLFEEKGKLEEVAKLATDWFLKYLI